LVVECGAIPPWHATAEHEPGPTYLPAGVISGAEAAANSARTCGESGLAVCARTAAHADTSMINVPAIWIRRGKVLGNTRNLDVSLDS
jgi:hypothetical protein